MVASNNRRHLLNIDDVAEILGCGRSTVMRLIEAGDLAAVLVRSGKRKRLFRIRPEGLERWILANERQCTRELKERV